MKHTILVMDFITSININEQGQSDLSEDVNVYFAEEIKKMKMKSKWIKYREKQRAKVKTSSNCIIYADLGFAGISRFLSSPYGNRTDTLANGWKMVSLWMPAYLFLVEEMVWNWQVFILSIWCIVVGPI